MKPWLHRRELAAMVAVAGLSLIAMAPFYLLWRRDNDSG